MLRTLLAMAAALTAGAALLGSQSCAAAASDGSSTPSTAWKEIYEGGSPAAEQAHFDDLARQINEIQTELAKEHHQPISRAFHVKQHVVVHAELQVLDGIPSYARYSLFKAPRTYEAIARYSNGIGFAGSDSDPDLRGLAVALEGPDGSHQDLLMTNSPVAVARDADDMIKFAWSTLDVATAPFALIGSLGLGRGIEMDTYLLGSTMRHVDSLADERYWSGGPVKLGPYAIKFGVRPVDYRPLPGPAPTGPDYLGKELARRLRTDAVAYDLGLQFFVSEDRTPIENAHQEWQESDAPFIPVARLVIPRQDVDSPEGQKLETEGEALSFSPWHTFWPGSDDELRPLGNLMRARKEVYAASARLRGAETKFQP